jgi:hypothetical protein
MASQDTERLRSIGQIVQAVKTDEVVELVNGKR